MISYQNLNLQIFTKITESLGFKLPMCTEYIHYFHSQILKIKFPNQTVWNKLSLKYRECVIYFKNYLLRCYG